MAKKYLSTKQWKKVYKKSEKDPVNTFEIEFFTVMNNSIQGKKGKIYKKYSKCKTYDWCWKIWKTCI